MFVQRVAQQTIRVFCPGFRCVRIPSSKCHLLSWRQHFVRISPGRPLCMKSLCCLSGTSLTLAFISPFNFSRHSKEQNHDEIVVQIPKEVFKKDKFRKLQRNWFWKVVYWIRLGLRTLRLTLTYVPILILYPFSCISPSTKHVWWKLLLYACEHSGPTFIKLGQWASTRRDLFAPEFCDMFSKLHASTKEHSWFMTKQKLRKAFGKNWRKIFLKLDRKPSGSGCIAQVIFFFFEPTFAYPCRQAVPTSTALSTL